VEEELTTSPSFPPLGSSASSNASSSALFCALLLTTGCLICSSVAGVSLPLEDDELPTGEAEELDAELFRGKFKIFQRYNAIVSLICPCKLFVLIGMAKGRVGGVNLPQRRKTTSRFTNMQIGDASTLSQFLASRCIASTHCKFVVISRRILCRLDGG
jgi:hypothetical protein